MGGVHPGAGLSVSSLGSMVGGQGWGRQRPTLGLHITSPTLFTELVLFPSQHFSGSTAQHPSISTVSCDHALTPPVLCSLPRAHGWGWARGLRPSRWLGNESVVHCLNQRGGAGGRGAALLCGARGTACK